MPASVSELSSFLMEQAEWYAVGEAAQTANIQGGTELKNLAANLTASVAAQEGLDFSGMPETSSVASSAAEIFGKAVGWLSKAADGILAKLTANVALIATLGGVYVAYTWLTGDDAVAHEQERQLGETVRASLANMTPADKKQVLTTYLQSKGTGTGLTTKHVFIAALAVGAFWIAWKWFGDGRR